jgi:SWI/SNF-related matrix-associated actin-dependent regulator 1 of chromatin subfamily A
MKAGLELMDFQKEGARLLARSARALLCWDPGVGKTPTAVRAAVEANAKRILVFCPPIASAVWREHFKDWSDYEIRVLDAFHVSKPYGFMHGGGIRIIPYSRAASVIRAACTGEPWDAAIIDEAHYLKSSDAQRTQAVYGPKIDLAGSPLTSARHVWCLTGTPLLNHPAEFWTHLHALRPDLIVLPQFGVMTEGVFTDRFCITQTTPHGVRILGGRNSHELAGRIKSLVDRKRLKDVLKDMPALRIVEHPLPPDTEIEASLRQEIEVAMRFINLDPEALDDDDLLRAFQSSVSFSTVRRLIGRAKVKPVALMVRDMLDDGEDEKVIVFGHHREVIRDLAEALKPYSPLVITGATTQNARESAIHQFQTNSRLRLIILAIEAAGEVITLHASHNVVIAEPSPVPAKNQQAIARAHRKGQLHPVIARFVLLPGTLDARLMSIVARKTRDIALIVDGGISTAPPPKSGNVGVDFPDNV